MEWQEKLKELAPNIHKALNGNVHLKSVALGFALDALLVPKNSSLEENEVLLQNAIRTATPQKLIALKMAEQSFVLAMTASGVSLGGDAGKNTLRTADKNRKQVTVGGKAVPVLGTIIVVGFFVVAFAIIFLEIEKKAPETVAIIGTIVGYVSAKADQVVSYYFGSSSGQDHSLAVTDNKLDA